MSYLRPWDFRPDPAGVVLSGLFPPDQPFRLAWVREWPPRSSPLADPRFTFSFVFRSGQVVHAAYTGASLDLVAFWRLVHAETEYVAARWSETGTAFEPLNGKCRPFMLGFSEVTLLGIEEVAE